MHYGLLRNPKRSDVETLVWAEDRDRDLTRIVLAPATPDVLDGLLASTHDLAVALAKEIDTCWTARRADPAMLPQPARQWSQKGRSPRLRFEGNGQPVHLLLGDNPLSVVSPQLGRRLSAARIFEDQAGTNPWDRE
jgi:hypothetical protein